MRRATCLFECLFFFLLLAAHSLTDVASTDGRPESDTSCQGHKTHGRSGVTDSAARHHSGR